MVSLNKGALWLAVLTPSLYFVYACFWRVDKGVGYFACARRERCAEV